MVFSSFFFSSFAMKIHAFVCHSSMFFCLWFFFPRSFYIWRRLSRDLCDSRWQNTLLILSSIWHHRQFLHCKTFFCLTRSLHLFLFGLVVFLFESSCSLSCQPFSAISSFSLCLFLILFFSTLSILLFLVQTISSWRQKSAQIRLSKMFHSSANRFSISKQFDVHRTEFDSWFIAKITLQK